MYFGAKTERLGMEIKLAELAATRKTARQEIQRLSKMLGDWYAEVDSDVIGAPIIPAWVRESEAVVERLENSMKPIVAIIAAHDGLTLAIEIKNDDVSISGNMRGERITFGGHTYHSAWVPSSDIVDAAEGDQSGNGIYVLAAEAITKAKKHDLWPPVVFSESQY